VVHGQPKKTSKIRHRHKPAPPVTNPTMATILGGGNVHWCRPSMSTPHGLRRAPRSCRARLLRIFQGNPSCRRLELNVGRRQTHDEFVQLVAACQWPASQLVSEKFQQRLLMKKHALMAIERW